MFYQHVNSYKTGEITVNGTMVEATGSQMALGQLVEKDCPFPCPLMSLCKAPGQGCGACPACGHMGAGKAAGPQP